MPCNRESACIMVEFGEESDHALFVESISAARLTGSHYSIERCYKEGDLAVIPPLSEGGSRAQPDNTWSIERSYGEDDLAEISSRDS